MPKPKLTIGLLVYNEDEFLEETIQCILSQKFENFELLIGNNASTDSSSKIIQEYSKRDKRIRHILREKNIGALQNWNDVINNAKGKYFVLAGGHDLWSPNYLLKMVEALDNSPLSVLAFAKTKWININGREIVKPTSIIDTSGMSDIAKLIAISLTNQHYLYGVMRLNAVKKSTHLQLEIIGSGEIFLQELANVGDFILVETEVWYRRSNRKKESRLSQLVRYKNILFSTKINRMKFKFFPHIQYLLLYLYLPFFFKRVPFLNRVKLLFPALVVFFYRLPIVIYNDFRWSLFLLGLWKK